MDESNAFCFWSTAARRHMKWHRRRCPAGNIKVAVGEAHSSLTPMADLTKARLLVNVLHTLPADRQRARRSFMNIPRTSHHRKKKKQGLPAPCAVPAMRCAVALLQPGACCLDMITCSMLPVVRTCRLSISPYSFVLLAMSQTEIRHKQLP